MATAASKNEPAPACMLYLPAIEQLLLSESNSCHPSQRSAYL